MSRSIETVEVESGRFVTRRVGEGAVIFAGVLHLPASIRPDPLSAGEAWTCQIVNTAAGQRMRLATRPRPAPAEDVAWGGDDLCGSLRAPVWRSYADETGDDQGAVACAFDVRMVSAFAESNGWSFVGVWKAPAGANPPAEWVDVGDRGAMTPIDSPTAKSRAGMAVPQLLRDLCVWPDGRGVLHTLPVSTPAAARERSLVSMLQVVLGQGHLSSQGRRLLELNLPWLAPAMEQHYAERDADFRKFLGDMADEGLLQPERAYTQPEMQQREDAGKRATLAMVVDQRVSEIKDLAAAVFPGGAAAAGASQPGVAMQFSIDGGVTWQHAHEGIRVSLRDTPVPGEDMPGQLDFNFTHEGLITDLWVTRDQQLDHNIATAAKEYCEVAGDLVGDLVDLREQIQAHEDTGEAGSAVPRPGG
ncbi:MAG: hypothetical protein K0Q43_90 [Ramlibacter sp.]|jgi:hypothetical protein|nr:hypothetical protein [Ramlibacter sp.]